VLADCAVFVCLEALIDWLAPALAANAFIDICVRPAITITCTILLNLVILGFLVFVLNDTWITD
jgi:hypothetical protein